MKFDVTRKEVKQAFGDFAFEYETGRFTSLDNKEVVDSAGIVSTKQVTTHGTYLRVKDPLDVLQKSAAVHAQAGRMAWGAHVPHNVYPVTVMLDAGGGSTKIVLKHPCVKRADSVRALTLLAILSGTKDTYSAMKQAFGPLLAAISRINAEHHYVEVPWAPRLPVSIRFELRGEDKVPTKV